MNYERGSPEGTTAREEDWNADYQYEDQKSCSPEESPASRTKLENRPLVLRISLVLPVRIFNVLNQEVNAEAPVILFYYFQL